MSPAHPDLVVVIGYGDELPVFRQARALWQFYAGHFPGIDFLFYRWTRDLKRGEVVHNGHDLLVGVGGDFDGDAGYAASGVWSQSENAKWVFRQVLVQDHLLRTRDRPFYMYHTTATSVVDFRGLLTAMAALPATDCFAGPIARLNGPEELAGVTFVSGASVLFSSDNLARMRERYVPHHPFAGLPNDVWQALMLHDVPRIALPSFNFLRERAPRGDAAAISALTRQMLAQGHYHFRVKTVAPQDAAGRREDIDPWIMLRIMETILDHEHVPAAVQAQIGRYQQWVGNGAARIPPRTPAPLYQGPGEVALNDTDL
ncbi:MAG TPA: hypothetical protein VFF16_10210 [Telluria sp.]|nr:hypothetical protein [Telluria sp.]